MATIATIAPVDAAPVPQPTPAPTPVVSAPAPHLSFFTRFKDVFERLFGRSPNYIHLAIAAISFGAPVVELVLSDVDPAALPIVEPIIARVQTGLATAYTLAEEGTASGATLASTLTSVQGDLGSIDSVAGIKSPTTQAKVSTLVAEIQQVVALINSEKAAATTA